MSAKKKVSERSLLKLAPSLARSQLYFKAGEKRAWSVDDVIEHVGFGRYHVFLAALIGAIFASDAVEVMLLSYLQVELQKEWGLSSFETASITAAVFAGELVGALFFGCLADRWGRRPVFVLCASLVAVAGLCSSYSASLVQMCTLRLLVGFGVGGFSVPFDLLAEVMPSSARAPALLSTTVFWEMGKIATVVLAMHVIPAHGWRVFLRVCAAPAGCCLLMFPLLPESPRWLATRGRTREAGDTLRRIARNCGRVLPPFELVQDEAPERVAPAATLLAPHYRGLSLALWTMWFCMCFANYGVMVLLPELFGQEHRANPHLLLRGHGAEEVAVSLSHHDYMTLLYIACLSLPAMATLSVLHVYFAPPRRMLLRLAFAVASASLVSLATLIHHAGGANKVSNKMLLAAMCGLCAISMSMSSSMCWMYTSEVYPTSVRATGHAAANSVARLGAILAPYADTVHLLQGNTHASALLMFATACVLGLLATLTLRIETTGRTLKDAVE